MNIGIGVLVGAVLLSTAVALKPAAAADLAGNCCADLEDRVADLEAMAARKGNRKVTLTVSGWVAEQVVHWDDGVESNVYLNGLGTAFATNFHFKGQAQISNDLTAGYVLHIEAIDSDSYTTNADISVGPSSLTGQRSGLQVLYSYWFLKSESLGMVSVGLHSQADDNAIVSLDSSGTLVAAYAGAYDIYGFNIRGTFAPGDTLIWGNVSSCRGWGGGPADCDGLPRNVVRYDTPTLAGFSAAASWGEDDEWAVAGRYSGTLGDFATAGVLTYAETTDSSLGAPPKGKLRYTQAGFYLQHNPSGAFASGGWGHIDQDVNPLNFPASDQWYLKSGMRLKLTSIGATIPYGEYLGADDGVVIVNDNGTPGAAADDVARVVDGSGALFWGFGVVQEIDQAAMSIWLRYRDHHVDVPGVDTKDMTTIVGGAFISF